MSSRLQLDPVNRMLNSRHFGSSEPRLGFVVRPGFCQPATMMPFHEIYVIAHELALKQTSNCPSRPPISILDLVNEVCLN
jgi:hypothetical protein